MILVQNNAELKIKALCVACEDSITSGFVSTIQMYNWKILMQVMFLSM